MLNKLKALPGDKKFTTDEDVYKFFGLNQKEIERIETTKKHNKSNETKEPKEPGKTKETKRHEQFTGQATNTVVEKESVLLIGEENVLTKDHRLTAKALKLLR